MLSDELTELDYLVDKASNNRYKILANKAEDSSDDLDRDLDLDLDMAARQLYLRELNTKSKNQKEKSSENSSPPNQKIKESEKQEDLSNKAVIQSDEKVFDALLKNYRLNEIAVKNFNLKDVFSLIDQDELSVMTKAYHVLDRGFNNLVNKLNAKTAQKSDKGSDLKPLSSKMIKQNDFLVTQSLDGKNLFVLNGGKLFSIAKEN